MFGIIVNYNIGCRLLLQATKRKVSCIVPPLHHQQAVVPVTGFAIKTCFDRLATIIKCKSRVNEQKSQTNKTC